MYNAAAIKYNRMDIGYYKLILPLVKFKDSSPCDEL